MLGAGEPNSTIQDGCAFLGADGLLVGTSCADRLSEFVCEILPPPLTPSQSVILPRGGRLEEFAENFSWQAAQDFCISRGGTLAVFKDLYEADLSNLKFPLKDSGPNDGYWVGLYLPPGSSYSTCYNWQWVVPEGLSEYNYNSYERCLSGRFSPNNALFSLFSRAIRTPASNNGLIIPANASELHPFLCKIESGETLVSAGCLLYICRRCVRGVALFSLP